MLSGTEAIVLPSRGCKYIAGDPKRSGWSYCGNDLIDPKSSWCEEHHAVVYGLAPPKPRPEATPVTTAIETPTAQGGLEDPMLLS
jgi:hypothetical protein